MPEYSKSAESGCNNPTAKSLQTSRKLGICLNRTSVSSPRNKVATRNWAVTIWPRENPCRMTTWLAVPMQPNAMPAPAAATTATMGVLFC